MEQTAETGPERLDSVLVPQNAIDSAYPYDLPFAIERFVDGAVGNEYRWDELPDEAVMACAVFRYRGEVSNGGHTQFVGNTGFGPEVRRATREGLALLGLDAIGAIFARLEAFADSEPARFERHYGQYEDQDPYFQELDEAFYAIESYDKDVIVPALSAWMRTRPWLTVVPDEAWAAMRTVMVPMHPRWHERREARRPAVEAELGALLRMVEKLRGKG